MNNNKKTKLLDLDRCHRSDRDCGWRLRRRTTDSTRERRRHRRSRWRSSWRGYRQRQRSSWSRCSHRRCRWLRGRRTDW